MVIIPRSHSRALANFNAEARRLIARGLDPAHEKQKAKRLVRESAANTIRATAEDWYSELASYRSAAWQENTRRWLDVRVYPEFGGRPADEVNPPEVLDLIRRIAREGHANTAECIRQLLSRVFRYGVRNMRWQGD